MKTALHGGSVAANLGANCAEAYKSFGVEPLSSEGKGHTFESCRVRQILLILFYSAICARELKLQFCLIQASKQSGENRRRVQIAQQLTMSVRSSNNNCFHKS
jgi:hypothetical protein